MTGSVKVNPRIFQYVVVRMMLQRSIYLVGSSNLGPPLYFFSILLSSTSPPSLVCFFFVLFAFSPPLHVDSSTG